MLRVSLICYSLDSSIHTILAFRIKFFNLPSAEVAIFMPFTLAAFRDAELENVELCP